MIQESLTIAPESAVASIVPDAILRSRLFTQGSGFGLYAGLPDPYTFKGLFAEASELYLTATRQESWEPDMEEKRGGRPRRSLLTSTAGPIQDAWYASSHLRRFLSAQLGLPVAPVGNRGSYSFYARKGDFLDIHRDVDTCDVTVITAVYDNSAAADESGALVLYPKKISDSLSSLRAQPHEGAYPVKLLPGQTIVIFGGVMPHRVIPVVEGQVRIISALCFRVLI